MVVLHERQTLGGIDGVDFGNDEEDAVRHTCEEALLENVHGDLHLGVRLGASRHVTHMEVAGPVDAWNDRCRQSRVADGNASNRAELLVFAGTVLNGIVKLAWAFVAEKTGNRCRLCQDGYVGR